MNRDAAEMSCFQFHKNRELSVDNVVALVTSKHQDCVVVEGVPEATSLDGAPPVTAILSEVSSAKAVDKDVLSLTSDAPVDSVNTSRAVELAAARLATILWLGNVYRTSDICSSDQVSRMARWVMARDDILQLISTQQQKELLDCLYRLSDSTNESEGLPLSKINLPPVPETASQLLVCTQLLLRAADLATINVAVATEVCRLPLKFLDTPSNSYHASVKRTAGAIKWLLDESKLQPRQGSEEEISLVHSSCYSLAQFSDAVQTAKAAARTELKNFTRNYVCARSPLPLFDVLLAPRVGLQVACHRMASESFDRINVLLVPRLRARLRVLSDEPRVVQSWPDVSNPADIQLPKVPGVQAASANMLQAAIDNVGEKISHITSSNLDQSAGSQRTKLHQSVSILIQILSLELAVGVLLLEDQKLDCYNAAAEKALKKKKNISARLHIGQPLDRFLAALLSDLPDSESVSRVTYIPNVLANLGLIDIGSQLETALSVANQSSRRPKVAKGCLDATPRLMLIRLTILDKIRSIFRRYGAVPIDTPVFELKETLTGKYGEDQKLIFDLKDQGGEQLSLRYDLTVPFARYVATHNVDKIKRFHIAKVYRRDEPQMARGRFREFLQCDFDIAGDYDLMVPDAEVLACLVDILRAFQGVIGPFEIKLSHRKLLDAIMEACGVSVESFRPVCSAIDKLDKLGWEGVKQELRVTKGLDEETTEKLRSFVELRGAPGVMISMLESMDNLKHVPNAQQALSDLKQLFAYLDSAGSLSEIVLDLSLARGLDYYTGVIFEAALPEAPWLGSVGAGGRYDNLIGLFGSKKIPSIGVSIGVERLFRLVESHLGLAIDNTVTEGGQRSGVATSGAASALLDNEIDVFVCSVGSAFVKERMQVCKMLRDAGIVADFIYNGKTKLGKQLQHASDLGIQVVVIIGEDEWGRGCVKVKRLDYKAVDVNCTESVDNTASAEFEVALSSLVEAINDLLRLRPRGAQRIANLVLQSKPV